MIPEKYYTILGLNPGADVTEVRKAYRARVKLCHPDIAQVSDQNRMFIELTEAYEFLLAALKEKEENTPAEEAEDAFVVYDSSMHEMVKEEIEKMRRMAREEARRKYREYKQSKEYRINQALGKVFEILFQLFGVIVILSALTGIYRQMKDPDFNLLSALTASLVIIVGLVMILFPMKKSLIKKVKNSSQSK